MAEHGALIRERQRGLREPPSARRASHTAEVSAAPLKRGGSPDAGQHQ